MNEETLFAQALALRTDSERQAFLDEHCGDRPELRAELEELLQANDRAGDFLNHLPAPLQNTVDGAEQDTADDDAPPCSLPALEPCDEPNRIGKLGSYEIIEVVGQGGMGTVLRAWDTKLHRIVALKVLSPELASSPVALKRFLREARAAAAVIHDNVVTIHAINDESRPPLLVMEFVEGQTLEQKIERAGSLSVEEIVRIAMQSAKGLAAAHAQGLIHRDVKPGNIMLENGVERVKLTDFGLARAADDLEITQTGMVAGTPRYMSPEQAAGQPIDHRSDLFSLGSVMYTMCTGRSPFRAETTMGVLRRICEDRPRPICDVNPLIPPWLAEIVDRLLEKDPDARYQTAREVADVLARCLAHVQHPSLNEVPAITPKDDDAAGKSSNEPNTARRKSARPWLIAAAALLIVLGLLTAGEATGVTHLAAAVIRIATGEGTLVVEVDDPEVNVKIEGADLVITGAGPKEVRLTPGNYHLLAEKHGKRVPLDHELVSITRGGREVVNVRLTRASPQDTPPQVDGRAASNEFQLVRMLEGNEDAAEFVVVSPDSRYALSGGWRTTLKLWDLASGKLLQDSGCQVWSVDFAPDSRTIIMAAGARGASIWDVVDNKPLKQLLNVSCLAAEFSPDGRLAACCCRDSTVRVLDVETGREQCKFEASNIGAGNPPFVEFSADGQTVVAVRQSSPPPAELFVFDVATGRQRRIEAAPDKATTNFSLSPDGRFALVSVYGQQCIRKCDLETGEVVGSFGRHSGKDCYCVKFLADGRHAVSGAKDRVIRVWDTVTGAEVARSPVHPFEVHRLAVTADGKQVLSAIGWASEEPEHPLSRQDLALRLWRLPENPTPRTSGRLEAGAFVVLDGQGVSERKYDTLAEAVQHAIDGDTIEIRGNGPFVSGPIRITRALTIRAGSGFWPVINFSAHDPTDGYITLINAHAPLVLEGLELRQLNPNATATCIVLAASKDLYVSNCRILTWQTSQTYLIAARNAGLIELRNSEFLGPATIFPWPGRQLVMDNCCLLNCSLITGAQQPLEGRLFRVTHNTFQGRRVFRIDTDALRKIGSVQADGAVKFLRMEAVDNVFDVHDVLLLRREADLAPGETEVSAARNVDWHGQRNAYASEGFVTLLLSTSSGDQERPAELPPGLAGWTQLWGTAEEGSLEGTVRLQGGDLLAKAKAALETITPDDFRLRPDSAGYHAGPDGKDLGADVDLVGPGEAYERWKKTPEYQRWLDVTRQRREQTSAKPEPGAFVVLGDKGIVVQKCDTLSEAVSRAQSGDTIEIRGNGPFVTDPIDLGSKALVIRAGTGFAPHIKRSAAVVEDPGIANLLTTRAALVLEGLHFDCRMSADVACEVVNSVSAPLFVTHCNLIGDGTRLQSRCVVGSNSPRGLLCNSVFVAPRGAAVAWRGNSAMDWRVENCLIAAWTSFTVDLSAEKPPTRNLQLTRNTMAGTEGFLLVFRHDLARRLLENEPVPLAPAMLESNDSVWQVDRPFVVFSPDPQDEWLTLDELRPVLPKLIGWRERQNVHAQVNQPFLHQHRSTWTAMLENLDGWNELWGLDGTGSVQGPARLQGDPRCLLTEHPETIIRDDFRLADDSAGHRAGPDGKDLGADVDLVGPGEPYERWKKTPEYQKWLEETGQLRQVEESNPEPLRLVRRFAENDAPWVTAIAYAPDGESVVTSSPAGLDVWRLESGEHVRRIEAPGAEMTAFEFVDDGACLVGVTREGRLLGREWPSREVRFDEEAHAPPGMHCVLLSDARIATTGRDGFIRIWDARSGRKLHEFRDPEADGPYSYFCLSVSPDERFIAAGGTRRIDVWDLREGRLVRRLFHQGYNVHAVPFSPDGRHLLAGGSTGKIDVFEFDTGRIVHRFEKQTSTILSLLFLPDGRHFVSGSLDGTLRVNALDGREIAQHVSTLNDVSALALAPDGRHVVSAGRKPSAYNNKEQPTSATLQLWELPRSVWPETHDSAAQAETSSNVVEQATAPPEEEQQPMKND